MSPAALLGEQFAQHRPHEFGPAGVADRAGVLQVVDKTFGRRLAVGAEKGSIRVEVAHVRADGARFDEPADRVVCRALAIELMGKRNRWSDVAAEMATYVRDRGFSVVENFVGHGIGKKMHEDPQVPNFCSPSFRRNYDFELETGLVIAVEPMVNMGSKKVRALADHWTQSTVDGQPSAHFEHTIAITSQGPEVLTRAPSEGDAAPA